MKNVFFKKATLVLLLANGAFMNINAQVSIGDNKAPETFSVLELISGNNKGLRLPQMTEEQRDIMEKTFNGNTLAMGLQIFNTDSKCVETWNGAVWIEMCAPELDYVDVCGNGTKWAKFNVDAFGTFTENETDFGMYYQWNRPTVWSATSNFTGWDNSIPTGIEWETVNDPCPTGWCVPTKEELECLMATFQSFEENYKESGVNGGLFGTAPNQIFLPAAGYRYRSDGSLKAYDSGSYWSSEAIDYSDDVFSFLLYDNSSVDFDNYSKANGLNVRCVKK